MALRRRHCSDNALTAQAKAHKTPPAVTAKTPRNGLENGGYSRVVPCLSAAHSGRLRSRADGQRDRSCPCRPWPWVIPSVARAGSPDSEGTEAREIRSRVWRRVCAGQRHF